MQTPIPYSAEVTEFLRRHHYRRLSPRAALIDMDGTLYDSMPRHVEAWTHLVRSLGIECDPSEFYLYEGRTGASVINLMMRRAFGRDATDDEKTSLYRLKTEYFARQPGQAPVMPGAPQMLSTLKEVGLKRVLVTGSGQGTLLDRLDTDFPGIFLEGMRVTSRDVTHGKPHPEPFIRAMQIAGVRPSEAMAIENAPLGVEAADRAGAFTVGITTGPIPRAALEEAGAAVVFGSMQQAADAMPMLLMAMLTVSLEP